MCGFIVSVSRSRFSSQRFSNAHFYLEKRGPDSFGYLEKELPDSNLIFQALHTRLSIIDQDPRSSQPFEIPGLVLVFNGELYNYKQLSEDLINLGVKFRTESDTEVFAWLIKIYGIQKALECAEGMWAFVAVDTDRSVIYVSRDRFSEKPLYRFEGNDQTLIFSSSIKAIRELTNIKFELNQSKVLSFLTCGYKSLFKDDQSFFKSITVFKSSSYEIISANLNSKTYSYWNPSEICSQPFIKADRKEIIVESRKLLEDAIHLRLNADVNLGFCLSGGIDSNVISAVASMFFKQPINTYSIISDDPRYAENQNIQLACDHSNYNSHLIKSSDLNAIETLENLSRFRSSPVSTISYLLQAKLYERMQADGLKVSFSGTGADEIFTGYHDHHNFYLSYLHHHKSKSLFEPAMECWNKYQSKIVRNPFLKDPFIIIDNPSFRSHIYFKSDEFSSLFLHPHNPHTFHEIPYSEIPLINRLNNELFIETIPVITQEDDANAMYYGIENRSPFLDTQLYSYLRSIDPYHYFHNGFAKSILRECTSDLLPEEISNDRKKIGFNAPFQEVFDVTSDEFIEFISRPSDLDELISISSLLSICQSSSLPNSSSKFLFYYVSLKSFLLS